MNVDQNIPIPNIQPAAGVRPVLTDYTYPEVRIYPGPARPLPQGGGKKSMKAAIQVVALKISTGTVTQMYGTTIMDG
jgi:hypothetical protein